MIDLAETIENQCAHMFDKVIVNGDIAVAFRELKADLERLEQEEIQWIPAEWGGSSSAAAARRSCGHLGGWIWTCRLCRILHGFYCSCVPVNRGTLPLPPSVLQPVPLLAFWLKSRQLAGQRGEKGDSLQSLWLRVILPCQVANISMELFWQLLHFN